MWRQRLDSDLAKWTDDFLKDVMSCMVVKSIVQRMSYICEPLADFVELTVFPAPVEHKGHVYFPDFEFSVLNMMTKFEHLSTISWAESHLSIEGKYAGRSIWFKFYPREPEQTLGKLIINLN